MNLWAGAFKPDSSARYCNVCPKKKIDPLNVEVKNEKEDCIAKKKEKVHI